jgi:superoxide dismutase, Cu-Zn family
MKIQTCLVGIGVLALLACDNRAASERTDGGERTLPPVAGTPPPDPATETGATTAERLAGAIVWADVTAVDGANTANARGTIRFEPSGDGLRVVANLEGLPPGKHAVHVHEGSSCGAPGEHFAFAEQAPDDKIAGNLGELSADSTGRAEFEGVVRTAQVDGDRSIVGRTVVVHAEPNDPGAADGNAGGAIACGVIQSKQDVSRAPLRGAGTKQ